MYFSCFQILFMLISISLQILDKIKSRICNIIGPDLLSRLQSFPTTTAQSPLLFLYIFSLFLGYFVTRNSIYGFKSRTNLMASSHYSTVETARYNCRFSANSFFSHTSRLWNTVPIPAFASTLILKNVNAVSVVMLCLLNSCLLLFFLVNYFFINILSQFFLAYYCLYFHVCFEMIKKKKTLQPFFSPYSALI